MALTSKRHERKQSVARRQAGWKWCPPFTVTSFAVLATYALELLNAVPDLATLYVPIGMGSGICGCILVRDLLGLSTEIVGVQSIGGGHLRCFSAVPLAG